MNERKLVKKAIKGNKEAFEKLLVLHSNQLYRTAFLYVGNREDAFNIGTIHDFSTDNYVLRVNFNTLHANIPVELDTVKVDLN